MLMYLGTSTPSPVVASDPIAVDRDGPGDGEEDNYGQGLSHHRGPENKS